MARSSTATGTSKWVHTSGRSHSDRAGPEKPTTGADSIGSQSQGLNSRYPPLPSQQHTFQRGMALAALQLPEPEQQETLAEVLDMLGIRHRVAPRPR